MDKTTFRKLTKVSPYLIRAASILFAAQFLYFTINSSLSAPHSFWIILTIFLSGLVFIGLRNHFSLTKAKELSLPDFQLKEVICTVLIITTSAMVTYFISHWFGVTTILSASITCVIYAYAFSVYETEAYSGVLAGMIGAYLSSHWSMAFFTALVTSIVFLLFKPYYKGIGGRGGTIPYLATTLVVRLLFRLETEQSLPMEEELIIPSFIIMLFITFLTYFLHVSNILSVVKSAMIVSTIFAMLIPNDYYTLTTAMFAGTIIGMSTKDRVDHSFHLFVVVVICFILFVPSFHILDGIGGKLGFLSLLSYVGSLGLKTCVDFIQSVHSKIINNLKTIK